MQVWLVPREPTFSPGHEVSDSEILAAVAAALRSRGHAVHYLLSDHLGSAHPMLESGSVVLAMCEEPSALEELARLEAAGVHVLNSPHSIAAASNRWRMLSTTAEATVPVAKSRLVATRDEIPETTGALWVKRADFHRIHPDDVTFAGSCRAVTEAVRALASRGVNLAVLQEHVHGEVVKVYGAAGDILHIAGPSHIHGRVDVRSVSLRAAAVLGLDFFGVDVIVDNDNAVVVDVNAWPSFAPCRAAAAAAIAACADARTPLAAEEVAQP